jgi:hypothetical protein
MSRSSRLRLLTEWYVMLGSSAGQLVLTVLSITVVFVCKANILLLVIVALISSRVLVRQIYLNVTDSERRSLTSERGCF